MRLNPDPDRNLDAVLALVLLALLMFASPMVRWWSTPGNPWYLPFLVWLLVIILGGWVHNLWRRHEP